MKIAATPAFYSYKSHNKPLINLSQPNKDSVSFSSTSNKSLPDKNIHCMETIYHTTKFFRDDIEWQLLADYILNNGLINVYSLACSDGSEPFTMGMILKDRAKLKGMNADKYFPVHASDLYEDIFEGAKNGSIFINALDEKRIQNFFTVYKLEDFFTQDPQYDQKYTLKKEHRNMVEFSRKDAVTESGKKFPENSVVMVRNVAQQLKFEKVKKLYSNLCKNLSEGSLLVIGFFDLYDHEKNGAPQYIDKILSEYFEEVKFIGEEVPLIYRRNGKKFED